MKTKEEIEKINNLTDLFDAWKEDQKNECNTSCENTFAIGVDDIENYKKSFCPDGFLNDNKDHKKADILFICRESNIGNTAHTSDKFWMKEVVKAKIENPSEYYCDDEFKNFDTDNKKRLAKRTQTKYFNCLLALSNDGNLQKCAYMNINKRGGISSCNMTRLKNYYEKYEDYILKEIEIIRPKKIVILGNLPETIINGLPNSNIKGLKTCGKPIYLYPFHPCVYRKSALKPLEELLYPPKK